MNRKQRRDQIKQFNKNRKLDKNGQKVKGAFGGLVPPMRWSMAPKIPVAQNNKEAALRRFEMNYAEGVAGEKN